jgi:ABC-2 type transport system permease protein
MSDLALTLRQTEYGLRGFRRNARAMVFTVVMPVVLLVMFNSIFGGKNETTRFLDGRVGVADYFTPGIIAYAIMLTGFASLLVSVTTNRERGILKRFRGTPMPPWVFLGAQILESIVVILVMVVVLMVIGVAAYDVTVPADHVPALIVYLLLGTFTMCSLGIALTRITTTADSASAFGPFATVILGFISGTFITTSQLPDWLEQIGRVFPLAHLAEGLQRAFTGAGDIDLTNVAVLLAWGVAALAFAVRTFRWEPQGAGA